MLKRLTPPKPSKKWGGIVSNPILWLLASYTAGTLFTLFILRPQIAKNSIEQTIDNLVEQGFLRYKKVNGEIEILKWNDNQNG
jgi:hypothetical protein